VMTGASGCQRCNSTTPSWSRGRWVSTGRYSPGPSSWCRSSTHCGYIPSSGFMAPSTWPASGLPCWGGATFPLSRVCLRGIDLGVSRQGWSRAALVAGEQAFDLFSDTRPGSTIAKRRCT